MPLSTSSSKKSPAPVPWAKTWLLAAVILLLALGSLECLWRVRGYPASLRDNPGLWAITRAKVKPDAPLQIVFIGDSRIQNGINLEVFDEAFPGPKPAQLALVGCAGKPLLLNLAEDESFRGIVISSTNIWDLLNDSDRYIKTEEYIQYYKTISPAQIVDQQIEMIFQKSFVFLLPEVTPGLAYNKFRQGRWPDKPHHHLFPDRSRIVDYSKFAYLELRKQKLVVKGRYDHLDTITTEERHRALDEIGDAVARIQTRGGRVVFVRFPSSGALRELEEQRYPRKLYWDEWGSRTDAITIHFEDYPALSHFECPDYVHMDQKDTLSFSKALAGIIMEKLKETNKK